MKRDAQRSRERYGIAPTVIGLLLLAMMVAAVFAFDPGGVPLPTCESTDSCMYMEVNR